MKLTPIKVRVTVKFAFSLWDAIKLRIAGPAAHELVKEIGSQVGYRMQRVHDLRERHKNEESE